jgi:hypothetical protein
LAVHRLATHIELMPLDRWLLAGLALLVPTIAILAVTLPANAAVGELARLFVAPPSLVPPLLGGLFARRGGAIIGLLVGLWAALVVPLLIVAVPAYQAPTTLAALLLAPLVSFALGAAGAGVRTILATLTGQMQRGRGCR